MEFQKCLKSVASTSPQNTFQTEAMKHDFESWPSNSRVFYGGSLVRQLIACCPILPILGVFAENPSSRTWKDHETYLDPDSNDAYSKGRDTGGRFLYLNSSEQQQSSEELKTQFVQ